MSGSPSCSFLSTPTWISIWCGVFVLSMKARCCTIDLMASCAATTGPAAKAISSRLPLSSLSAATFSATSPAVRHRTSWGWTSLSCYLSGVMIIWLLEVDYSLMIFVLSSLCESLGKNPLSLG